MDDATFACTLVEPAAGWPDIPAMTLTIAPTAHRLTIAAPGIAPLTLAPGVPDGSRFEVIVEDNTITATDFSRTVAHSFLLDADGRLIWIDLTKPAASTVWQCTRVTA